MSKKEANPYNKVWNSVEDEETSVLEWVKNGTLFPPTLEELGHRHKSHARFLLARARDLGRTTEGVSVFNEALYHRDRAKEMFDKHNQNVLRSK